ncbi:MAG TPA: PHP domain-containing protein [Gemmatimonadales bacterium]|nr:PHP domain-containing protein [Gemmatimonadales bacterium]
MPTARVDLHCHSTASDGEYAPAEVARRARTAGLAAIALTDHDTTDGVAEATRTGEALGVRVVSGCEFSVKAPWGELHLLAYFLPPGHPRLEQFLVGTRTARRRRAEQIVGHLRRLGLPIALADVERVADGGALGRPHVARVLVQRGLSADIGDAFTRYLGRGRPAYVEKPLPSLDQVTDLVHGVGGVAVAAHLGGLGTEDQIRRFQEQGLDGLEVRHPSHPPHTERRLTALAERLGLAISGGSDWHGDSELGDSHAPLGGLDIPAAWLEGLEERRGQTSGETVSENREGIP